MTHPRYVLCFLSESQRVEYLNELAWLAQFDAEFVYEDSLEKVLSLVGELDPHLVIAGMTIGPVKGLEFMEIFMNQYEEFDKTFILLPDKSDGLPPVAHTRDKATGRSSVDSVDFHGIASFIDGSLTDTPSEPRPSAPSEVPVIIESAAPAIDAVDGAESTGKKAVEQGAVEEGRARRPKWLVPLAVAGGIVVLAIAGYIAFSGKGEEAGTPSDQGKGPVAAPSPVAEPPVVAEPPADATPSSQKEPEPQDQPALPEDLLLPIVFSIGEGRPNVSDPARLDAIVKDLQQNSTSRIELTGYASSVGRAANNNRLGMFRATMVMKLLVRRGISRDRFVLKSGGSSAPIASNQTDEGQAKNRRVTVRLIP